MTPAQNFSILLAVFLIAVPLEGSEPGRPSIQATQPASDPMASDLMKADARLADVAFVDPLHGWAVGDRGTIWHTDDGGKSWQLQPSGVSCKLESVFFLDEKTGWATGGYSHPYTGTTTGLVLSTRDGGRRWDHNPRQLLPAGKQIRFFDARRGWLVGQSSALFPAGVFTTDDGGLSYSPLPAAKSPGWVAGDFLAPYQGVLADRTGMAATVRRGEVEPATTSRFGLRLVARMKLVPEVEPQVYGWMVGQGGLLMLTADLGVTWQGPPGGLPEGTEEQFDFAALAVRGPNVWVAGSPGTRVFHSSDAGRTWIAFPTGQSLPIRSLAFVDDRHGWAVGELGTILSTIDGGQTWSRNRSGGTRAALLGVFSEPEHVPWELLAQLSGNEGYLGVVETLNRRDPVSDPRAGTDRADRLHEAVVGVGASGGRRAWRFPIREPGLKPAASEIVALWDRANDGRGLEEMKAHVVRQIRLWRPDVIVTHELSTTGDDPLANLVHQVVLEAVDRAADATSHAEQITRAGLEPWQVKKVYASLKPGMQGTLSVSTAELAERLGRSLADVAAGPRALLDDRFRISPGSLGFRLAVDKLSRQVARDDFFTGIVLQPGGEARRELLEPSAETIGLIRRIAQKRRNMEAILQRTEQDPQGGVGLLAQAGDLTRGLDPDGSARLLYQMAQQYYQAGKWPMAAEAFGLLAERHPEHPLARAALVWLVQYYASGEAAWRVEGKNRYTVTQTSKPAIDLSQQENRPELAAALGKRLQQTEPAMFAEPSVAFPLAVASRLRGFPAEADRFYMARSRSATRDAWWACARGEQWLAEPTGVAPKAMLRCAKAPAKPRLDGRLDDAVWKRSEPAQLRGPDEHNADRPSKVMLAYDDEFLYLAVEARRAPGADSRKTDGPRPRDPDLSDHDRVELAIDLDRDFATYYRLAIDDRGWPAEECWGDPTWNPTWFVAAASDEGVWTAEAAIPLDQLTGRYPRSGEVWAIGIQRTIPGVGLQSWNTPASTEIIPEGFGYLIFE